MNEQYELLINNTKRFKKGVKFTLSDVIYLPQGNLGIKFHKAVDNNELPYIRFIGKNEANVDMYEIVE